MKIFLHGKHLDVIAETLQSQGFCVVVDPAAADLILCYGGDGAMLGAAALYPDKIKFPVRDAETAPLCAQHSLETQLQLLQDGKLSLTKLPRLCGEAKGKRLYGVNDIFIHNRINVSAMRYNVRIDGEVYGEEIVGDGVGVSTVHGSTAYYRSITHSIFRTGIGLAFSNSTELVNHLVLPENSRIHITILRGPSEMVADNSLETVQLDEGDEVTIQMSGECTPVLGLDIFMCPVCRKMRHDLRNTLSCKNKGNIR